MLLYEIDDNVEDAYNAGFYNCLNREKQGSEIKQNCFCFLSYCGKHMPGIHFSFHSSPIRMPTVLQLLQVLDVQLCHGM